MRLYAYHYVILCVTHPFQKERKVSRVQKVQKGKKGKRAKVQN